MRVEELPEDARFTVWPRQTSDLQCLKCEAWSPVSWWRMKSYFCDQCPNEHESLICPRCGSAHTPEITRDTFPVRHRRAA